MTRADVSFEGQVVLVTGGARGIGLATAKLVVARGGRVLLVDAGVELNGLGGQPSIVEAAASEIPGAQGSVIPLSLDLAEPASAAEVVSISVERFGRLDALVHLAGVSAPGPIGAVDDSTIERLVAVNATAAFRLCRAAYPVMREQGQGRIVLTTSGHAFLYDPDGPDDLALYALGKGAQLGLAMSLATTGRRDGILVNALSPVANTRMYRSAVQADALSPGRVAGAVAWLASDSCRSSGLLVRTADGSVALGEMSAEHVADLGDDAENPDQVALVMQSHLRAKPGSAGDRPPGPDG